MALQPSPSAKEALKKYYQLKERQHKYYFQKAPLQISNMDFMAAYSDVFNLINNNTQEQLNQDSKYEKYETTILQQYRNDLKQFATKCRQLYKESKSMQPEDQQFYLRQLIQHYKRFMNWTSRIFRIIQKASLNVKSIFLINEGLMIFRTQFIQPIYNTQIFELCFKLLQLYKQDKLKQYQPLQEIIKTIGVSGFTKFRYIRIAIEPDPLGYQFKSQNPTTHIQQQNAFETDYFKKNFSNNIIHKLQRNYRVLAGQLIKLSAPQYTNTVLHILKKQQQAADTFYPNAKVKQHIIRSIQQVLIHEKCQQLLGKQTTGLRAMLQKNDIPNLIKLFQLMKRSSNIRLFSKQYQTYIDMKGSFILDKVSPEDQKNAKKEVVISIINEIYQLYERINQITHDISSGDLELQSCQNLAFQQVFNKTNKLTNFLAYYADHILRKQQNAVQANSDLINKISRISKFLYSYDAFLKLYQKLLGLRILYDNFKNRQTQYSIINMLKNQAGASALNKITCMITDVKFSQNYNQQKMSYEGLKFGFDVMMLTSGSWQIQDNKNGKAMVPPQLRFAVEKYQQIYLEWFPGRVITWVFNYGRAIIHVQFNEAKHLLIINNYQLLILLFMQRNGWKKVKVSELISQMKIDDQISFISSIMMLVKTGVLNKEGTAIKLQNKQQKFWLNTEFKHKSTKVGCYQVPRYLQKVGQQNNQLVLERSYLVDAAIVKIMKSRKTMQYHELLSEVQKICKTFKADVGLIKKRIQNCQQREFIMRDQKDMNCLIYKP